MRKLIFKIFSNGFSFSRINISYLNIRTVDGQNVRLRSANVGREHVRFNFQLVGDKLKDSGIQGIFRIVSFFLPLSPTHSYPVWLGEGTGDQ